ncbi:hypothetical protein Lal_00048046 [Lupinus albus]|nr:hypothetical protein Lal_00048046 [Lupinus albus]
MPKLSDEESLSMFINTLQPPFFDRMIGNFHSDFRQIIRIGERIENRSGSGKIKKSFANKVIQSDHASEDMEEETSFTEILSQPQCHIDSYPLQEGRPPYPQGFNPNASCEYHTGAIGHFIEDCDQLKRKVQYLINSRLICFHGNVLV